MPRATLSAADARAVAYAAVAKAAAKRTDRDLLAAGTTHQVQLALAGRVAGRKVAETISGTLVVGEDQVRQSATACDQAELLAAVAAALDKDARDRLFARLRDTWRAHGTLPHVDAADVAAAKALLSELRSTQSTPVRGNVTFVE